MTDSWKEAVLKHFPHGEDGQINGLNWEDATTIQKILLKYGYAVCMTDGDFDDEYKISWVFAGTVENLDYADYKQVVFTNIDYMEDYPEAYYAQYNEGDDKEEEFVDDTQITIDDEN